MTDDPADVPTGNPTEVTTAFFVVVERSGRVSVLTSQIPNLVLDRTATLLDIETYAAQSAAEAGRAMLAQSLRPPSEASVSDRVAQALAQRSEGE